MKFVLPFAAVCVLLASCKKENDLKATNALTSVSSDEAKVKVNVAYVEHTVEPEETDPTIKTKTGGDPLQYAYVPTDSADRINRLFVFIPGSRQPPSSYRKIVTTGASQGYFSIGVAYTNMQLAAPSTAKTDSTVMRKLFAEYFTGNDSSTFVNIGGPQNGLENRITKMVIYMRDHYPTENWGQFLTNQNKLRWNRVVLGGHSQGSDHVMYISKNVQLYRAAYFGGPGNWILNDGTYPPFMTNIGLTDTARQYAFSHTQDPIRSFGGTQKVWKALHMVGVADNVDDNIYNGSYKLSTSVPARDGHSSIVFDYETPNDSTGNPLYAPVWTYMCFPAVRQQQ